MNAGTRSGNPTYKRNDDYYRRKWEEIIDKEFIQTVFHPYPALVCKELVNGHHMWKPFDGSEYDNEKYDLVKDRWDHEHCSICDFKITDANTYWYNFGRIRILCDECHEYYCKT